MFAEQRDHNPSPSENSGVPNTQPPDLSEDPSASHSEPSMEDLPPELGQYLQDLEERPVRTVLREIADRAREGVEYTRDATVIYIDNARKRTSETAQNLTNGALEAGKTAVDATSNFVKRSAQTTRKVTRKIPGEVAKIYERVGADPEKDSGLISEIVKITPFLGAAQEYADAWRAYHKGQELNRAELIEKGQILCVAAMINGKFDILTLGAGRMFRHTPRLAVLGLRALTAMRSLNAVSKLNLDPVSHLATYLVRNNEKVRSFANATLESISPNTPEQDPPDTEQHNLY